MSLARPTGRPAFDAAEDFLRARRRAVAAAALRRLTGRDAGPAPMLGAAAAAPHGEPRLEVLALGEIKGSVDPAPEFDSDLRPRSGRARHRWERIALAHRRGDPLPPIVAWRTADGVYVLDGRHRVSVARALGLRDIDAWVHDASGGD